VPAAGQSGWLREMSKHLAFDCSGHKGKALTALPSALRSAMLGAIEPTFNDPVCGERNERN